MQIVPEPDNPFEMLIRLFLVVFVSLAAFFGASGDMSFTGSGGAQPPPPPPPETGSAGGEPVARPTLAPGLVESPTVIESVEALILESDPPQISLNVRGYQPDGCTFPVVVQQAREGSTVRVSIYREMPSDIMCTMMLQPYSDTIVLDGTFEPGSYTIDVNGFVITVTI